jgi:predicted AAA+ superfamily ATPase
LKQIDEFIKEKASGVFLLLGKAGSGKSVVLQQKFIECIHAWSADKPLPIFFNLANNTSLPKILQTLDEELTTNLQKNIKGKHLILFIDSFDEGVDM